MPSGPSKTAILYRMVMGEHVCPHGLKSKWQLERHDYIVEDHWLRTREETEAFKAKYGVKTTPQTFIAGKRIGGNDGLACFFGGQPRGKDATSYMSVAVVFAVTALMAIAASIAAFGKPFTPQTMKWFIAFSMSVLAILKLQDIDRFSTVFLNYDLLARKWVPYGYIYPFAEALAGLLMISGKLLWFSIPVALFIGSIGAVSVFKAVYIDKRKLKCACVGGATTVPLGFASLTENVMMVAIAVWMLVG